MVGFVSCEVTFFQLCVFGRRKTTVYNRSVFKLTNFETYFDGWRKTTFQNLMRVGALLLLLVATLQSRSNFALTYFI